MKRFVSLFLCVIFCISCLMQPINAGAVSVSAESAVLYDPLTESFMYEKNADTKRLIASTTKIMTALVVLERENPDRVVRILPDYLRVEGSSMYLREREEITVLELLYGLLLMSGNDAGLALANVCGGDVETFVSYMNETAQRLGLSDTSFANPHGLDHEMHFSTAKDLARLTAYAMQNETFRKIVSTKYHSCDVRSMKNHNKLLWQIDGVVGVKTGFTKKAGRCLVSACERDGRMLIAVTLHAPSDWNDHAVLYENGFASLASHTFCSAGETALTIPVISGESSAVNVVYGETCTLRLDAEQVKHVRVVYYVPQFVYAPTVNGGRVGTAMFELHGTVLARIPLHFAKTIAELHSQEDSFWKNIISKFA